MNTGRISARQTRDLLTSQKKQEEYKSLFAKHTVLLAQHKQLKDNTADEEAKSDQAVQDVIKSASEKIRAVIEEAEASKESLKKTLKATLAIEYERKYAVKIAGLEKEVDEITARLDTQKQLELDTQHNTLVVEFEKKFKQAKLSLDTAAQQNREHTALLEKQCARTAMIEAKYEGLVVKYGCHLAQLAEYRRKEMSRGSSDKVMLMFYIKHSVFRIRLRKFHEKLVAIVKADIAYGRTLDLKALESERSGVDSEAGLSRRNYEARELKRRLAEHDITQSEEEIFVSQTDHKKRLQQVGHITEMLDTVAGATEIFRCISERQKTNIQRAHKVSKSMESRVMQLMVEQISTKAELKASRKENERLVGQLRKLERGIQFSSAVASKAAFMKSNEVRFKSNAKSTKIVQTLFTENRLLKSKVLQSERKLFISKQHNLELAQTTRRKGASPRLNRTMPINIRIASAGGGGTPSSPANNRSSPSPPRAPSRPRTARAQPPPSPRNRRHETKTLFDSRVEFTPRSTK